jgi:oligo-alginate lyase
MPSSILSDALPPHPRLLARTADWERLRHQVESDEASRLFWRAFSARADRLLKMPPLTRVMTGRRLLLVSREALERIAVLSLVARVGGNPAHAERAKQEMLAVAAFEDWNPSHFLDVAEMSLALSMGFDWLNDELALDERAAIEDALIDKALRPSLDAGARHNWWQGATENWAQVCHGGLSAAAICIAGRDPALAETILRRAIEQLAAPAGSYAPDGVYPEGPMYWGYGTGYHVILCAMLERLTGDCGGVDSFPGFAESAEVLAQLTAPSGCFFNFGDCRDRRRLLPPLFWMARRFNRPEWVAHDLATLADELEDYLADPQEQHGHYSTLALALLWHEPVARSSAQSQSRVWIGRGIVPVAVFRTADLYLAVKGGSASVSHAHMDEGSFILESHGVRFLVDPGMQDYESLERTGLDLWNQEQTSERWGVFRLGADAHNILRFDGAPQRVDGNATLASFSTDAGDEHAVFDLTSIYADAATSVRRCIRLVEGGAILIEDEWTAPASQRVTLQLQTEAAVEIDGRAIRLSQAAASLMLQVLDTAPVKLSIVDASKPRRPFDVPNPDLKTILVECAVDVGRLRVLALPPEH